MMSIIRDKTKVGFTIILLVITRFAYIKYKNTHTLYSILGCVQSNPLFVHACFVRIHISRCKYVIMPFMGLCERCVCVLYIRI